ncbi:MAG: acyl carrier protein [Rickettsiales bacterium]
MSTEIEAKVIEIVADHLGIEAAQINADSEFMNDLGADSLDQVELVMSFEEEFNIEIPDDAAEKIVTVKDAVDYIVKHSDEA